MMPSGCCNLFVYGTLQSPQVLQVLLGRIPFYEEAHVQHYSRHPVKGQVFPGMIESKDTIVEGRLLLDVLPQEMEVMDWFEGKEYKRITVDNVAITSKPLENQQDHHQQMLDKVQTYLWCNPVTDLDVTMQWDYHGFCENKLDWYLTNTVQPCRQELNRVGTGSNKNAFYN